MTEHISTNTRLMVDGHVHLYDCYNLDAFFTNAVHNLNACYPTTFPDTDADSDPVSGNVQRILMLTEGKTVDFFTGFQKEPEIAGPSGYRLQPTDEDCSLLLTQKDKPVCWLLKGRQIVTAENLEVLAVATGLAIPDGLPIEEVLDRLAGENQPAVLTWGFGKWFFKRGRVIEKMINRFNGPNLFVGDNSGRPDFWPVPPQFKQAEAAKIKILNGSDPLPFESEITKPGSYGFALMGDFDPAMPAQSLCRLLMTDSKKIIPFGKRDSLGAFLARQVKMQLKKHLGK